MMRLSFLLLLPLASVAFVPQAPPPPRAALEAHDRRSLLGSATAGVVLLPLMLPSEAFARGRGTQPAVFQRYQGRITSYGTFLKSELPKIIEAADWNALKEAVAADTKTKKGKIGKLYNGESAMSLWAATYSETSITDKTKAMQGK